MALHPRVRETAYWKQVFAGTGWDVEVRFRHGHPVVVVWLARHDESKRCLPLFFSASGVEKWKGVWSSYVGGAVTVENALKNVAGHTHHTQSDKHWAPLPSSGVDAVDVVSIVMHVADLQGLKMDKERHVTGGAEGEMHVNWHVAAPPNQDVNKNPLGDSVGKNEWDHSGAFYGNCVRLPAPTARRPKVHPKILEAGAAAARSRAADITDAESDAIWACVQRRKRAGAWDAVAAEVFGEDRTGMQVAQHYRDVLKPRRDPRGVLSDKRGGDKSVFSDADVDAIFDWKARHGAIKPGDWDVCSAEVFDGSHTGTQIGMLYSKENWKISNGKARRSAATGTTSPTGLRGRAAALRRRALAPGRGRRGRQRVARARRRRARARGQAAPPHRVLQARGGAAAAACAAVEAQARAARGGAVAEAPAQRPLERRERRRQGARRARRPARRGQAPARRGRRRPRERQVPVAQLAGEHRRAPPPPRRLDLPQALLAPGS